MRGDTNFKRSDSSGPTVYSLYCDEDEIFMVSHDVMLTDLNNMTDYRVEWF